MSKEKPAYRQMSDTLFSEKLENIRSLGPNKIGRKAFTEVLKHLNFHDLVNMPKTRQGLALILGSADKGKSAQWQFVTLASLDGRQRDQFALARGLKLPGTCGPACAARLEPFIRALETTAAQVVI